jgi:DNA-binding transcriptional LysR family regulator
MDSRRASYLLAVIDQGSFSAAARSLHLSQPALSQAVKELEDQVGAPLLARFARGVAPTAAGMAFAAHARRALFELEAGRGAVLDVIGLIAGSLSICCLPTLASDPVALAVGSFRDSHPKISIEILNAQDSDELVEMVRTGRSELGVSSAALSTKDLVCHRAGSQELRVIFPPGTLVPVALTMVELSGFDLVTFPKGASMRSFLDDALSRFDRRAQVAVEVTARDAVVPLVLAGAGAALVPQHVADVASAQGAVVRTTTPELSRDLFVLHRSGTPSNAASAMLKAMVRAGTR